MVIFMPEVVARAVPRNAFGQITPICPPIRLAASDSKMTETEILTPANSKQAIACTTRPLRPTPRIIAKTHSDFVAFSARPSPTMTSALLSKRLLKRVGPNAPPMLKFPKDMGSTYKETPQTTPLSRVLSRRTRYMPTLLLFPMMPTLLLLTKRTCVLTTRSGILWLHNPNRPRPRQPTHGPRHRLRSNTCLTAATIIPLSHLSELSTQLCRIPSKRTPTSRLGHPCTRLRSTPTPTRTCLLTPDIPHL